MLTNNNPKIRIYEDFIENYNSINAWTGYDNLSLEELKTISGLDGYVIVEIAYHGIQDDSFKFEAISIDNKLTLSVVYVE